MPQVSVQQVKDVLKSFGVIADEAIATSFAGLDIIDAKNLLANYAIARKTETEREQNDPLNSYIKMAGDYTTKFNSMADTMYGQLDDLMSSAPKLFGEFTPDQVSQYLAPLQTEFQKAQAITEGAFGRRGLAGSSTEAQALALGTGKFQEDILSQGLSVGMDSQAKKAKVLQDRIAQLQSAAGQAFGLEGQATGQKSSQDLAQSNLLASLPFFLKSADSAAVAAFKAANPEKGFFQKFNEVTGAINTGISTVGNLATFGKDVSGPFGMGVKQSAPQTSTAQIYGPTGAPAGSDALFANA